MKESRIAKIIKHTSKVLKEVRTELFGENIKEKPDDKGRDIRIH